MLLVRLHVTYAITTLTMARIDAKIPKTRLIILSVERARGMMEVNVVKGGAIGALSPGKEVDQQDGQRG